LGVRVVIQGQKALTISLSSRICIPICVARRWSACSSWKSPVRPRMASVPLG
jgi:hypothetical protein